MHGRKLKSADKVCLLGFSIPGVLLASFCLSPSLPSMLLHAPPIFLPLGLLVSCCCCSLAVRLHFLSFTPTCGVSVSYSVLSSRHHRPKWVSLLSWKALKWLVFILFSALLSCLPIYRSVPSLSCPSLPSFSNLPSCHLTSPLPNISQIS